MRESYTVIKGALVVKLTGELDQHGAVKLRRDLDEKICAGCNNMIFDFSELNFMDSSGIGLIIGRYKNMTALGGSVCVAAPRSAVEKVIRLSAIDKIIPLYKTVEEALLYKGKSEEVRANG